MRNFPHQVNRITKIRGALQAARELISAGEDFGNDGTFGYSVVRAGVYPFRGLHNPTPHELELAIQLEQQKPASNQGPRTFARDLRRTLALLGFLRFYQGTWQITELGNRVLALPDPPDPEASRVWQEAVLSLEVNDNGVIHPARNMLRMATLSPGIEKGWLAFALDMNTDSEQELTRVLRLQGQDFQDAVQSVGATKYQAENAVKILPSLLEQLGLLSIDRGICTATPTGMQELTRSVPDAPATVGGIQRRRRTGYSVIEPRDVHDLSSAAGRVRTTEEQLHTAALLEERTTQHQRLVRRVLEGLQRVTNVRCSDDAFDILAESAISPEILLIEAKTLQGDGLAQARIALGQLLFYEFFDIAPIANGRKVLRIVAFDSEPGQQVRGFLTAYDVHCIVVNETNMIVPDHVGEYFQQR